MYETAFGKAINVNTINVTKGTAWMTVTAFVNFIYDLIAQLGELGRPSSASSLLQLAPRGRMTRQFGMPLTPRMAGLEVNKIRSQQDGHTSELAHLARDLVHNDLSGDEQPVDVQED